MQMERAGVDAEWQKGLRAGSRADESALSDVLTEQMKELERYLERGAIEREDTRPTIEVLPKFLGWERYLDSILATYGALLEDKFERKALREGTWDAELVAHAFAARFTANMIFISTHDLFPTRFPGRTLRMMTIRNVGFTALGFASGAHDQAATLASLQVSSYHKGHFFDDDLYPTFVFMLQLLADHLGQPEVHWKGDGSEETVLRSLFESWRTVDLEKLTELCLAACDFHTHRCKGGYNKFADFDDGRWVYVPIEILLLFKLRAIGGLENPHVDHPLMRAPFDRLPGETGFRPNVLIDRVRARMMRDGYNEAEIVRQAAT